MYILNGGFLLKVLVGIPLYNEQAYLCECIRSLYTFLNQECQAYEIAVLLIDDGSTDQSQAIYEELAQVYPFNYLRHSDGPLGYGRTILTLFCESKRSYDILITFDADLQHDPASIKDILENFDKNPTLDIVSTSRYLSYRFWKKNTKVPIDRYITNMLITKTVNRCFSLNITDAFCGLKGYKTLILPTDLDDAGYAFPLVFWHYVYQNGLNMLEIETPIIYRLDRRTRGEWKQRTKDYFTKLESLVSSTELKRIIKQDYKQGIEMMTEIIDHHTNFPIYTYQDFLVNEINAFNLF
ncbi:MAG: glycosyltransferase family 2 protein [Candidatus Hodarchaeota archaeon]